MFYYLEQIAALVHFLDVFICKDAAGPFELTLALSGSFGDNRLMHAGK